MIRFRAGFDIAPVAPVFRAKVSHTNAAIHAARGDHNGRNLGSWDHNRISRLVLTKFSQISAD